MILAAGLGTRLRPLSGLRAKPALPVLGRPVIAWLLEFLAQHGIDEVAINIHHRPRSIEDAVARFAPPGLSILYSREDRPLGTGGGIAAMRDFLSPSDPAVVLAGDTLLDCDLGGLALAHCDSGADATLLLQPRSPENANFATVGIDDRGRVRRIAGRFDLGGETTSGVFVGLRFLSPALFEMLPDVAPGSTFEDLSDWWMPLLASGRADIRGHLAEAPAITWQPVGTPEEYLKANLSPPSVSYFDDDRRAAPGTRRSGGEGDVILGPGAEVGPGARLSRCVVWEQEKIPAGFVAHEGVFAQGKFYFCGPGGQPGSEPPEE
jgi:mannose-1-phosphate guanylyltransferase